MGFAGNRRFNADLAICTKWIEFHLECMVTLCIADPGPVLSQKCTVKVKTAMYMYKR